MNRNNILFLITSLFLSSALADGVIPIDSGEESIEFQGYLKRGRLVFVSAYLLSEDASHSNCSAGTTIFHEYDPHARWEKKILIILQKRGRNHSDCTSAILDAVEFSQAKGHRFYGPDDVACKMKDAKSADDAAVFFVSAEEVMLDTASKDVIGKIKNAFAMSGKSGVIQAVSPSLVDCHFVRSRETNF
jgi:hypothetical protein